MNKEDVVYIIYIFVNQKFYVQQNYSSNEREIMTIPGKKTLREFITLYIFTHTHTHTHTHTKLWPFSRH